MRIRYQTLGLFTFLTGAKFATMPMASILTTLFATSVYLASNEAMAVPISHDVHNFENYMATYLNMHRLPRSLPATAKVVVDLPDGSLRVDRVQGRDGAGWLRARGIQYAQHPIGDFRWQPPKPYGKWKGLIDATRFGDNCITASYHNRLESTALAAMSESCLYLNIWFPDPTPAQPKAIMVWFHGGSFTSGGTSAYGADGIFAYRRDVLLVTVNYRLGALGFLGGSAVARTTTDGSSGNFALQDTRLALAWVRRNCRALGGDPDRITIFGESSGSSMVASHLTMPRSAGFFHSAIMQSGAWDHYTVQQDAEAAFQALSSLSGCAGPADDALKCMRSSPVFPENDSQLRAAGGWLLPAMANTSWEGWWGPVVDGVELIDTPINSAQRGEINPVKALVMGTNRNEARTIMPATQPVPHAPNSSAADLHEWLNENYANVSHATMKEYRAQLQSLGAWETAGEIYTDSQYLCPTHQSARWAAQRGIDTFVYRLDYQPSTFNISAHLEYWQLWCDGIELCREMSAHDVGVGHGADISLLFMYPDLNETDLVVGKAFVDYWQNFATSGNPNRATDNWPVFTGANTTMVITDKPAAKRHLGQRQCEFWATHSGNSPH